MKPERRCKTGRSPETQSETPTAPVHTPEKSAPEAPKAHDRASAALYHKRLPLSPRFRGMRYPLSGFCAVIA